jgi:hypothetical protein
MEDIVTRGIQVLVPPDANKRKGPRPEWDGGLYAFMRRVLATDLGAGLYGKRRVMIEPVFGDMKFNRRIDRFQRRGRSPRAARSGASSPRRTTSWDETARRGPWRWCPGAGLASRSPGPGLCGRT